VTFGQTPFVTLFLLEVSVGKRRTLKAFMDGIQKQKDKYAAEIDELKEQIDQKKSQIGALDAVLGLDAPKPIEKGK
jgi:prefoldin subunit 5